jgi:hypothetical protein
MMPQGAGGSGHCLPSSSSQPRSMPDRLKSVQNVTTRCTWAPRPQMRVAAAAKCGACDSGQMWQTLMQQTGCSTCFAVDAGEDGADGEAQAAEAAGDAAAAVWRRQHAAPPPPHPACWLQWCGEKAGGHLMAGCGPSWAAHACSTPATAPCQPIMARHWLAAAGGWTADSMHWPLSWMDTGSTSTGPRHAQA